MKKSILTSKIYKKIWNLCSNAGCHQRSDRSFFVWGIQFPVCARCTGVLIGYILEIFFYSYFKIAFSYCCLFIFIMFFDWLIQNLRIKVSTNIRRLFTGIFGGIGVMGIQLMLLEQLIIIVKGLILKI